MYKSRRRSLTTLIKLKIRTQCDIGPEISASSYMKGGQHENPVDKRPNHELAPPLLMQAARN